MSTGGLNSIPAYSRNRAVRAIRDYYAVLFDMYLDGDDVLMPPRGGWPAATMNNLQVMGKSPQVLDLLSHLPYIRGEQDDGPQAGVPGCHFADWRHVATISDPQNDPNAPDGQTLRRRSEPAELVDRNLIPADVVGLTYAGDGREHPIFLLDTRRGIVHWCDCPDEIRDDERFPVPVTHVDNPFDWEGIADDEAEWRAEHPAWGIADFFGILEQLLRDLRFVPVGRPSRAVLFGNDDAGELVATVRDVYRRHGWEDDEDNFEKEPCLAEVEMSVRDDHADFIHLYDEAEEEEEQDEGEEEEGEEEESEEEEGEGEGEEGEENEDEEDEE